MLLWAPYYRALLSLQNSQSRCHRGCVRKSPTEEIDPHKKTPPEWSLSCIDLGNGVTLGTHSLIRKGYIPMDNFLIGVFCWDHTSRVNSLDLSFL